MHPRNHPTRLQRTRQRGVAAVLAMMFLVIFSSLAAAMALVSQGNLATADSHLKVNRALAAAETGLYYIAYQLDDVARNVKTREGDITPAIAEQLWTEASTALHANLSNQSHNGVDGEPYFDGGTLHVGPIAVGPDSPKFEVELTPHPLTHPDGTAEDYDAPFYQRPPYSELSPPVSNAAPLDATWVRVVVTARDRDITRSITTDFRIGKTIPYAILSKSRVMVGRNVTIDGPLGSTFLDTHLAHGHPIQMASDFRGLSDKLDADLDALTGTLIANDHNGDNRINLMSTAETEDLSNPEKFDTNQDGFIDEFDFFLAEFDDNGDGAVSLTELESCGDPVAARQLIQLIDDYGNNDGMISDADRYAKVRGEVQLTAAMQGWNDGAAGGSYQDYFEGPVHPGHHKSALTFEAAENAVYEFGPEDFDISTFRDMATGDLMTQASNQAATYDPDDPTSPQRLGQTVTEAAPFGAAHPYDYYDRQVFENMTFRDVAIPKGTNALFRNCNFIGVTFVETETDNTDPDYNYAGIQDSDGDFKHPDKAARVDGAEVDNTKDVANNIRFENCVFEGSVVTDVPEQFTQVRNKLAFTGKIKFKIDDSVELTGDEKRLFKRSTILAPHYSVEMGTFISPYDTRERVDLSGTIVAGVLDMRGQVQVKGTVLTTFEPESDTGPVIGDTSPQFNTTLGYFDADSGDLEAEIPDSGVGVIHVEYDPTLPLPDGVLGPIQIKPVMSTYYEGRSNG